MRLEGRPLRKKAIFCGSLEAALALRVTTAFREESSGSWQVSVKNPIPGLWGPRNLLPVR